MKVTGLINVFVNEITNKKGEVRRYFSTTIAKKLLDAKKDSAVYEHDYLDVVFAGENFPQEKVAKLSVGMYYSIEVKDGYLSFDKFAKTDGSYSIKHKVVITDATIKEAKVVTKAPKEEKSSNDLPF